MALDRRAAAMTRRLRGPTAAVRRGARLVTGWIARQEGIVLLGALGVVLALFGFVKIAEEVAQGDLRYFDEWLLRLLRRPESPHNPIGPIWLLEAAQDVTALGGRTLLVAAILSAVGYLALERKYGAMWLVVIASIGGGVLSTAMKELFARDRPAVVPHFVSVASPSFPSGHSMLCAVLYLTLGALLARFAVRRRTKAFCLLVAILVTLSVGVSRVYLGVHYPTDVLAGWCAGFAWALVYWLLARYLQYRGVVDQSGRA